MSSASNPLHQRIHESITTISSKAPGRQPQVALILGSGLGSFANRFDDLLAIDYQEIPHFPVSGVEGHAGRLVFGQVGGTSCLAMQGRVHYYEGYDLETVTFPLRTMIELGVKTLIVTNAAGGIGPGLAVGDLVLIRDHINFFGASPLRGENDPRLGPRFPDMTYAYSPELRSLARKEANAMGLELGEGVYAGVHGPQYETPAEIQMMRGFGADLVGMSTVPETIVANHMGAEVLGISCVTNLAAGTLDEALSHDDVTGTARQVETTFVELLTRILTRLAPTAPPRSP